MQRWSIGLCCLLSLLAVTPDAARGAASVKQPSLSDVSCSRLHFSLSPDGTRAVVHDVVTFSGGFVSTSPFAPESRYEWLPVFHDGVYWSKTGDVIFEQADGYGVVDPMTRSTRRIKIDVEAGKPGAAAFGPHILPRFLDRELFVARNDTTHDVQAINIDTGATRLAVDGRGADYPRSWFIGSGGREVSRLITRWGAPRFMLAAFRGLGGGTIELDPFEELTPLGNAEALALSRGGRFLALNRLPTGERVVVVVDPRTLQRHEVLKLATNGPFAIGATTDGSGIEWSARFAPLPMIDFAPAAPAALRSLAEAIPNAWLEFQGQSRDGVTRIFKLTELSGRAHFVRLSRGRVDTINVPCRQPSRRLATASRPLSATTASEAGWIVRRHTAGAGPNARVVLVLPDESVRTIDPMLDPLLEALVGRGMDVRTLIYPGSWSRGRLRSGTNVSIGDLVRFARAAVGEASREARANHRRVVLIGRGLGALLALHLGSTALAERIDGIFAEGAIVSEGSLPVAVQRDVGPLFSYNAMAGGVPVMFFHGAEDRRTSVRLGGIQFIMSRRGDGARPSRCVVIEGMGTRAETPFQWQQAEKAFEDFLRMVEHARANGEAQSVGASSKCELVPAPRG